MLPLGIQLSSIADIFCAILAASMGTLIADQNGSEPGSDLIE
jgi:hypothetical protein